MRRFSLILLLTGGVLIAFSYFFVDENLARFFSADENLIYWKVAREVTNIGLGQHYFLFVFVLLAFLYFLEPRFKILDPIRTQRLKIWAWGFFAALMGSGALLRFLKYAVGRQRPHVAAERDPSLFLPFTHDWNFHSFPSGHSQVLFTVATMLVVLDRKRWLLWYSLAAIFSFTRVMTYSHFLSDVIGGALVGILGTWLSLLLFHRFSKKSAIK